MSDNKVTIRSSSTKDDAGNVAPYAFYVSQNGLQHGFFRVDDYDTPDGAKDAANALAEQLCAVPWVSPFRVHRSIIMANYGAASKLRRFVLSLYNGHAFPVDLSDISGLDKKHFGIVLELMGSYHKLGENDADFMSLAADIKRVFKIKARGEKCAA